MREENAEEQRVREERKGAERAEGGRKEEGGGGWKSPNENENPHAEVVGNTDHSNPCGFKERSRPVLRC